MVILISSHQHTCVLLIIWVGWEVCESHNIYIHLLFHFCFLSFLLLSSYCSRMVGSIVGTLDQYGQKITKETYTRESKIIPDWMNLKNLSLAS